MGCQLPQRLPGAGLQPEHVLLPGTQPGAPGNNLAKMGFLGFCGWEAGSSLRGLGCAKGAGSGRGPDPSFASSSWAAQDDRLLL